MISHNNYITVRNSHPTQYTGHMIADDILASLPYYDAPEIQKLTAGSVKEFIGNCSRDRLSGVLGIFPETTSASECDHLM